MHIYFVHLDYSNDHNNFNQVWPFIMRSTKHERSELKHKAFHIQLNQSETSVASVSIQNDTETATHFDGNGTAASLSFWRYFVQNGGRG